MKQFVSGESDAKGLSVILPYIAVDPAAVAIRRPEHWNAWNLAGPGSARRGMAWQGWSKARNMVRRGPARRCMALHEQGTWAGVTTSKHKTHTEQGIQHNTTLDTCTRKTTQLH